MKDEIPAKDPFLVNLTQNETLKYNLLSLLTLYPCNVLEYCYNEIKKFDYN